MDKKLDMISIRYLNLFEKMTGIRTQNCFPYNNAMIFAVPPALVSRAIGKEGSNIRQISSIIGKRVKVVALPENNSIEYINAFVSSIVHPVNFRKIEILEKNQNNEKEVVITAGQQSKAALIGRGKKKLEQLQRIIAQYFKINNLRIV